MGVARWPAAIALGLLLAHAAGAQIVRGTLVQPDSATVVAGGIVQLVDTSARVLRQTLSRRDGSFALAAPAPGTYRLRALRIGFTPSMSDRFTMTAATDTSLRFVMNGRAVVLAPVDVRADRRCAVDPDSGSEAAHVWEEIRKALAATVLSQQARTYDVRLGIYSRRTDRLGRHIADETMREVEGRSLRPFTTVPPDTLARYGFVRGDLRTGMTYYGADAALLGSDAFVASHCLRLVASDAAPRGHGDWIGLGFEPVRTAMPDIAGTLWVDRRSAELRELDYRYTGVPRAAQDAAAGGHTEFMRRSDGVWLVRRWAIRMPVLQLRARGVGAFGRLAISSEQERLDTVVAAMQVTGGELLEITTRNDSVWRGRHNAIRGTVVSGPSVGRLPQLIIAVKGTERRATTDSAGQFAFESLLPGPYELRVEGPRPDSLGVAGDATSVVVPDSGDVDVRMVVRANSASAARGEAVPSHPGAIAVHVIDARTGAALAGAEVSLPSQARVALTDGSGRARVANISTGAYHLLVRRLGYVPVDTTVVVTAGSIECAVALAPTPPTLDTVAVTAAHTPAYLRDFEIRKAQGIGTFLTEDQLSRHANESFPSVVIQSIAGVRVVVDQEQRRHLASTRGSCGYDDPESAGGQASCFSAKPCIVAIYLDGERLPENELDLVRTSDLAAAEYYSGASVPARYRRSGSACGVMLLWSKR